MSSGKLSIRDRGSRDTREIDEASFIEEILSKNDNQE